jgi:hypothetical protein
MAPAKTVKAAKPTPPMSKKSKKALKKSNGTRKVVLPAAPVPSTTFTSGFEAASPQGGKEVDVRRRFYHDLVGNEWNSIQCESISGLGTGDNANLKKVKVLALPPAVNGYSNSSNNVMVLASVAVKESGPGPISLQSNSQTMLLPSNAPRWVTVLDCNVEQLQKRGLDVLSAGLAQEICRLALINPDTGNPSTQTRIQFCFEVTYAIAAPLKIVRPVGYGTMDSATAAMPTVAGANQTMFPEMMALHNVV